MQNYYDIAFGPAAEQRQRDRGSAQHYASAKAEPPPDALGPHEIDFLSSRDSFYLSSIGENGWPYVQHRGGPVGFIHMTGPAQIAWAERSGNRQFVTNGNLDGDDRVSIIAVDYPNRSRMKLFGHAHLETNPSAELLTAMGIQGRTEGVMVVDVVAFDWNCPKYITPRYTVEEFEALRVHAQAR